MLIITNQNINISYSFFVKKLILPLMKKPRYLITVMNLVQVQYC